MNADFDDVRRKRWLESLTNTLCANGRETLLTLAETGTVGSGSTPTGTAAAVSVRILEFHLRQALERSADGDPVARNEVAWLRDRLVRMAPPPAPAAAPGDPGIPDAIQQVYRLTVGREASADEVDIWQKNLADGLSFPAFLLLMVESDETRARQADRRLLPDLEDADVIQHIYRIIERRGALPGEIEHFRGHLDRGTLSRETMLQQFFTAAAQREIDGDAPAPHDGLSCWIMGTDHTLTLDEWTRASEDTAALAQARAALDPRTPFTIPSGRGVKVSILTSLFCGGDFIERFMDNMLGQSVFDDACELLILDADSPENEAAVIERHVRDHPNIRYRRCDTRIGIYEAWNEGVKMARGDYLSNANLDDLRRGDSFEIQAGTLDALPFVDVVYQDFYYSFDPALEWEEVAAFGYKSDLPLVTPYNMLRFNLPHNAPMWRRGLHDELGLFDTGFRSAGDYDFWMRCLVADKTFYKINEPHVVYYQNPKGLSTRADTRGVIEAREVLYRYAHKLIGQAFMMPLGDFATGPLGLPASALEACDGDRNLLAQAALRDLARRAKPGLGGT